MKKEAHYSIKICFLMWKGNHILIEFQPMGANARSWVQIDTRGCNSMGMGAALFSTL